MKKFIYSLLALTAVSLGFVSCDEEEGENGFKHDTHPEVTTAGTYVGKWKLTTDEAGSEPQYEDGTIILAATDSAYVTYVTVECPTSEDINGSSTANIGTMNDDGYYISNKFETNGLGVEFYGQVEDDKIVLTFDRMVKKSINGKKPKLMIFTFLFEGSKQ